MHEGGTPVTEVCAHYGISRKTFYKWYGRYQESGRGFHVLKDRSRRPTATLGLYLSESRSEWRPCGARPVTAPGGTTSRVRKRAHSPC